MSNNNTIANEMQIGSYFVKLILTEREVKIKEKYSNNLDFHNLVDLLYNQINQIGEYSDMEIKDAATMVAILCVEKRILKKVSKVNEKTKNYLIEHRICPKCDGLGFLNKKLNLSIFKPFAMECSYCGEEFFITPEQTRRILENATV